MRPGKLYFRLFGIDVKVSLLCLTHVSGPRYAKSKSHMKQNKLLTHNSLTLFHFKASVSLSVENMLHDMRNHRRRKALRLWSGFVSLPFSLMAQLYN